MTLFAPERLTLARQLEGLRKSELAAQIGKSSSALAAWESGAKRPTPANVAELAMSSSLRLRSLAGGPAPTG